MRRINTAVETNVDIVLLLTNGKKELLRKEKYNDFFVLHFSPAVSTVGVFIFFFNQDFVNLKTISTHG